MSRRPKPPPPPDLSAASAAAWPGLTSDLEVATGASAVDLALLADLLRACDRLAQLRELLERDGLTVTGSQGQVRPHPVLAVESALRREVAQGWDRLGLSSRHRGFVEVLPSGRLRRG